jgi:hypothetical protein
MNPSQIKGAIALIISQTDYGENKAKEKLLEWNYDYMSVIKEYLNPNFNKKKTKKNTKSINQRTMTEIRCFMDNVNKGYNERKEKEEFIKKKELEYKKKIYAEFLKQKAKYPDCKFDPPKINTCKKECQNPMCPGELSKDNTLYKKDNSHVENKKISETVPELIEIE